MHTIPAAPVDMKKLARTLQVVAESTRLLILHLLMEGVQCNCELGEALGVPPNLVSHHLRALREAGLVNVERDPYDARWVYYSINRAALDELQQLFGTFFDPARQKPRRQTCGPQGALTAVSAGE
jgi:ArsR family transcriptional regulator